MMRLVSTMALMGALISAGLGASSAGRAAEVHVAVAANFTATAEQLAVLFKAQTGDELVLSFGSTGALYAQISQGAPFEVFLAADAARPALAIQEGLAVAGSDFTYAVGALALYGPGLDMSQGDKILTGGFGKLAIADPAAAPYGQAAVETLEALGQYEALRPKLVTGANISQTLQFVSTGNAELGFVAASQIVGEPDQWRVPANLHAPIAQDAVLLTRGENAPAAQAFLGFLRSGAAIKIIEDSGYDVPKPAGNGL